jgi:ABC-type multidrug transport system fused ATPase/permease subunit
MILLKSILLSYGGVNSAMKIHEIILNRLLNSPISFFDQTPTGRVLNTFSKDQEVIDNDLPSTLISFFTTLIVFLFYFKSSQQLEQFYQFYF